MIIKSMEAPVIYSNALLFVFDLHKFSELQQIVQEGHSMESNDTEGYPQSVMYSFILLFVLGASSESSFACRCRIFKFGSLSSVSEIGPLS